MAAVAEQAARRRHTAGALALALAALSLLLAACVRQPPPTFDQAALAVSPPTMEGVTQATVQVKAPGPWTLSVSADDAALSSRVALSSTSGSGPRSVTLTVDPDGVAAASYRLTLRLVADTDEGPKTVIRELGFSFPRVYGTVQVISTAQAGVTAQRAGAPAREGAPLANAEPLVNPDGTITLIVAVDSSPLRPEAAGGDKEAARLDGVSLAGISPAAAAAVAGLANGRLELSFPEAGVLLVDVPAHEAAAAMAELAASTGIRGVAPSIELHHMQAGFPNDHEYPRQWNFGRVGMAAAWQLARGTGVTIAVIDGGFHPAHPDLQAKIVGQYDFGDSRPDVSVQHLECGTHGTHVAGIAAAATDNAIGVAGAAPAAGLWLLDIDRYADSASAPTCTMSSSALLQALQHVYNSGSPRAQVVNMSIGSPTPLGTGVQNALDTLRGAGVVLIGAAGNTACSGGTDTFGAVSYPAAYASVWAIGATDPADERACYSHVGSELFLAAPGGDDWFGPGVGDMVYSTIYDVVHDHAHYAYMNGTSMAAPLVAGVVALMLEAEPGASILQLEQALKDTAVDLGAPGFDEEYGYGLLAAPAAIAKLQGIEPPPDPLGLLLDVDRYPLTPLGIHTEFVLVDSITGLVTIEVYSDDDEDGTPGEPGEYYGTATIDVRFDVPNHIDVLVFMQ